MAGHQTPLFELPEDLELLLNEKLGAGDRVRTGDVQLGNLIGVWK
jgi:hypothetical protein